MVARGGAAVACGRVDGRRGDRDPGAGRVEAVGCGCECGERARGYRGRRGWARVGFRVEVVGAAEGGGWRGGFGVEFGRFWISEMT